MSNMIKAYSVRYKEEARKIDLGQREEQIHAKVADAVLAKSFIGGLSAVALTEDGEVPMLEEFDGESSEEIVAEGEDGLGSENVQEDPTARALRALKNEAALAAWRDEERKKLKEEITGAEKLAIKIEMEKAIRTQADVILEQARAQGEQVKVKAKLEAEAQKLDLFENAKREGYEEGKQRLLQEQEAWNVACEEKEQALINAYETRIKELEPQATDVVIKLLEHMTGVCLESRKGIVTYLVTKALNDADRSSSYLIKVSKEDLEEVKAASEQLRSLFEREVTLEIVQDVLLKKGECMIETDSNIIDCSLGTQLEGLFEDIRLLSVQERM